MDRTRISVRLDPALRRRLEIVAARTGKRESVLIREALDQHLPPSDDLPSAYDVARKLGIIGCIKGGPRDLSTNPDYFEGFGDS